VFFVIDGRTVAFFFGFADAVCPCFPPPEGGTELFALCGYRGFCGLCRCLLSSSRKEHSVAQAAAIGSVVFDPFFFCNPDEIHCSPRSLLVPVFGC